MSRIKRVMLLQPASAGGNFEYVAIPRQGMLYLSAALAQLEGPFVYDREIWFEDRSGLMDPDKDLDGVDILMLTALINEAPRAYQVARMAKEYHPDLITIGGGPQMGPLPEEAFDYGHFDVIVQREGEDIIGQLCDVLLERRGPDRNQYLNNVPGISYREDEKVVYTKRAGLVRPDFVELPDFRSIRDLTPANPMAGGVMESIRGCTEKCTYCQVIQQFLGYRLVSRETEFKRLEQLHELAADGLIHTSRNGSFQVFISDDLHTPPLRAVKFRNERLERLQGWKGRTDNMNLIIQARAEIGQDPELAHALQEANVKMLYLGVESDNAENLKAVNKRQDPGQMHRDLAYINELGFTVVAMTIIGLPYDTEESIMALADWGNDGQPLPDGQLPDAAACHVQLDRPQAPERARRAVAGRRDAAIPALYRAPVRSLRRAVVNAGKPRDLRQVYLPAAGGRRRLPPGVPHPAHLQTAAGGYQPGVERHHRRPGGRGHGNVAGSVRSGVPVGPRFRGKYLRAGRRTGGDPPRRVSAFVQCAARCGRQHRLQAQRAYRIAEDPDRPQGKQRQRPGRQRIAAHYRADRGY